MSQGIFGLIDFNRPIDRACGAAEGMAAFLNRGAAGSAPVSCESGTHYEIGMKRYAIRTCQQVSVAMDSRGERLAVMHGEILNYHELCRSYLRENMADQKDLALVLKLYAILGYEFAATLNGMFTVAILDKRDKCFTLLNDRFGLAHQVYWTIVDGRLCFATHLRSLLAYPGIRRQVDPEAFNLFLKYSYVPSPWSIIKGVRKLRPGHSLLFRDGAVEEKCYWEFGNGATQALSMDEAVVRYRDLLKESISRRLESGRETGILLSGGLDSSANVALAAECTDRRLKTFSVGFDNPAFDERPYARMVADRFHTEHFECIVSSNELEMLPEIVWHIEEPYFEFGLFLTHAAMASARKHVDVLLGGEGADQLFGTAGFAHGRPMALRHLLQKLHMLGPAQWIAKHLNGSYFSERDNAAFKLRLLLKRATDFNDWFFYGFDQHELRAIHRSSSAAELPLLFHGSGNGASSLDALYRETRRNQDLSHYVNDNIMVKSGRMANMYRLVLRESFLDPAVTDFLLSLDRSLLRPGSAMDFFKGSAQSKPLHRKAVQDLLPRSVLRRPKQGGFVPVAMFLDDPVQRKRIYDHLLRSEAIGEYFRPDYLRNLFGLFESVRGRPVYWHNFHNSRANRILFLLTFSIWHSLYIDGSFYNERPENLSFYLEGKKYARVNRT